MTAARDDDSGATVTVRYWAAARAAAGVAEERAPTGSLAEVLDALRLQHPGKRFAQVLAICSLLADGVRVDETRDASTALRGGTVLEVLPPFAGG